MREKSLFPDLYLFLGYCCDILMFNMDMAKRLIALALLCMMLFNGVGITPQAYGIIDTKQIGESLIKFYGALTQHRFMLYLILVVYYEKFQRWPSSREEFENYILDIEKNSKAGAGPLKKIFESPLKDVKELEIPRFKSAEEVLLFAPFECTVLENGDLLIEGKINEKLEKALEGGSFSKCYFSIICHAVKEGYTFQPSPKTKSNRDYFNLPGTIKKSLASESTK